MSERSRYLRDRLLYPSSQDAKDILKILVPPSALLMLAGFLKKAFPAEAQVIAHLVNEQASPEDVARNIKLATIPGFVLAGLLFVVLSSQEKRNRISYGDHLTVSKVAPGPDYFAKKLFPELQGERYLGEIHFRGKWKMRYSLQDNAHSAMRKLFSDLHELAVAVENNDPRLSDFNYFVALSSMVTPRLGRFGISVVHYKNQLGLPPLGEEAQKDLKLIMRPVMATMVSRDKLIENKEQLARLSRT